MTVQLRVCDGRLRGRTESLKRLSKRDLERGRLEYPPSINAENPRPRTYAECEREGLGLTQPCPFVSCAHHLYLDVQPETGSIKLNFPGLDVDELPETCALAVANRGGETLEAVALLVNLTRERIRQLEARSLAALRCHGAALGADLTETVEPIHIGPGIVRVLPPDTGLVEGHDEGDAVAPW